MGAERVDYIDILMLITALVYKRLLIKFNMVTKRYLNISMCYVSQNNISHFYRQIV